MRSTTLMNVSVKCEYALRAVFELALRGGSEPTRIATIAERQGIPQKFLESILAELKKSGLLESKRGAEGGYLLGRPAELITVGEVLRSVEGGRTGRATLDAGGALDFFWQLVDGAVAEIIDRTTFADLVREWRERQTSFVPNWEI